MAVIWAFSYHLIYNANNWEERRNWKIMYTKPPSLPGHTNWPEQKDHVREKTDYWDQGFKKSAIINNQGPSTESNAQ